ncbi:MAG: hypothetical protein LM567_04390, partial [Desulfurococcaceae archaeon]|nr:hypothetical protein [Desulfurococcaceae archaeon]
TIALVKSLLCTVKLAFNASGDRAEKILSTAWLFKLACHRVLSRSKELLNALIPSKIAGLKCSTAMLGASYPIEGMLMELCTWSTAFGRALGS